MDQYDGNVQFCWPVEETPTYFDIVREQGFDPQMLRDVSLESLLHRHPRVVT